MDRMQSDKKMKFPRKLMPYWNTLIQLAMMGKKMQKAKISIGTEFSNKFKDACSVFPYHQCQVKTKTRKLLFLLFLSSWLFSNFE